MNNPSIEAPSVVTEREMPHPPEKVWRALTQPYLIEEWLMRNDFKPEVDHHFELGFEWGVVVCRVLEVEPNKKLAYTWTTGALQSVVTWTLTPTSTGTHLRMKQVGFPADQARFFQGAKAGWPRFFAALEQVLMKMDQGVQKK